MGFLSQPLLAYVEHFEHKKLIHSTENNTIPAVENNPIHEIQSDTKIAIIQSFFIGLW